MEKSSKKNTYKIIEIFDEKGQDVKVFMEDIFKTYCLEKMEQLNEK